MNHSWKKRLGAFGWLTLGVTAMGLLVAGVAKKNHKKCAEVKVEVTGANKHIFLDEKEVLKILNASEELVGEPVEKINLQLLERRLEQDKWIRNAELFFDNNGVLQVKVEEREPVARIFTIGGNSFYIDSSGVRLPLSEKMIARVPMFTSFPTEARTLRSKDSALLVSIKTLASFIQADTFWNAQVAQVDITPNRTFEMVPTIGNHTVVFGKGDDFESKFNRLYSFYQQVWTKTGLEKYSVIDVQYKGQVVATRRGSGNASVDSVKAREAFFRLLEASKPDTIDESVASKPVEIKAVKPTIGEERKEEKKEATASSTLAAKVKEEIAKADVRDKADKKTGNTAVGNEKDKDKKGQATAKAKEEKQVPKAVMKKKGA